MKIAVCIGCSTVGGVGTSTYILASGMRKAGHQADILATDGRRGPDYDRARRDGWPIEAICLGERWLRRRLEITLERLSQYDVVINNHSMETNLLLPALPAHAVRLSVIRSTNNQAISEGKASSPYLDALVGISPEVQRLLLVAHVACRTEIIPNAVMVTPSVPPALQNPLGLAYLGRLTDVDKNVLILPEIARACKERGIKFTLDVAGEGRDRQTLEEKIRVLEVSDCVRLHGTISRDAVGGFLNRHQFGLFPSNYEGFGLALVEAMASGCVPIASDIPSYRWILGEDADTLLAPVKNAQAYADRIVSLAADPERYLQIQDRLRQRQQSNFSPGGTVNRYLNLVKELNALHDNDKYTPTELKMIVMDRNHRLQCSKTWSMLQLIKDALVVNLKN